MDRTKTGSSTRWAAMFLLLALVAAACGSGDAAEGAADGESEQASGSNELCDLFDESASESLALGIDATLQGAAQESIGAVGDTCVIEFVAGEQSVTLTIHPEGAVPTDQFVEATPGVTTDGATMSTAETESGVVIIEASTSDPAGISTWDASLAGAFALTS